MPKIGFKHSGESKKKMSISHKANPTKYWLGKKREMPWFKKYEFKKGETSWNKGKELSLSHKEFLSKSHLGQTPWNKGRVGIYSKETRRKMSDSLKGKTAWNKGKHPDYMQGKNHHAWKGGITLENHLIRNSAEMKEWRHLIFERDNYACQICGQGGGELRANHIKRFADFPELRTEKSNGITICERCDYLWVINHEHEWESYFNFVLEAK